MASPYRETMVTIHCELCLTTQVLQTGTHLLVTSTYYSPPWVPSSAPQVFSLHTPFPSLLLLLQHSEHAPAPSPTPTSKSQGLCIDVPSLGSIPEL